MAIIEYSYQRATQEQLEKCIRWCQNQFQLRDWIVLLCTDNRPPGRFVGDDGVKTNFGRSWVSVDLTRIDMWVNIDFIKKENANPYSTTIHEMLHVLALERADDVPEQFIMVLEPLFYRLYCQENGLKIAAEKEPTFE